MYRLLLAILLIGLGYGCSGPSLYEKEMAETNSFSIAINTSISNSIGGKIDLLDIPANRQLANEIISRLTRSLKNSGYHIKDKQLSIGKLGDPRPYYVVYNKADREREPDKKNIRYSPFFSDRLDNTQLANLYSHIETGKDNPAITGLGFKGDATLAIAIDCHISSIGQRLAASAKLIAALPLLAVAAKTGQGLSSNGHTGINRNRDDMYTAYIRLYNNKTGHLIWMSTPEWRNQDKLIEDVVETVFSHIPIKYK